MASHFSSVHCSVVMISMIDLDCTLFGVLVFFKIFPQLAIILYLHLNIVLLATLRLSVFPLSVLLLTNFCTFLCLEVSLLLFIAFTDTHSIGSFRPRCLFCGFKTIRPSLCQAPFFFLAIGWQFSHRSKILYG